MKRTAKGAFLLLAAILAIFASPARPIWYEIGTAVCKAPGEQIYPQAAHDGSGGIIVVWTDCRESDCDIYAQRIDSEGIARWAPNGVLVCGASDSQTEPRIVSVGSGRVVIAWEDERSSSDNDDVYAQKLDADGTPLWAADGVPVCTAAGWQRQIALASDGAGGAVLAWTDVRAGDGDGRNIYAQRIRSNGSAAWTADGVLICGEDNWQQAPAIANDGASGAISAWKDLRTGVRWRLYTQRVDSSGVVMWTANGVRSTQTLYDVVDPKMISDGAGGAVIAWHNLMSGGDYDVYVQRINASGGLLWGSSGIDIASTVGSNQMNPQIDGMNTDIVVGWQDYRNGDADIYAQRINGAGAVSWTADGATVVAKSGNQILTHFIYDGDGGAFAVWSEYAYGATSEVYAQHMSYAGAWTWPAGGTFVNIEDNDQINARMITDGLGGGIVVAWQDERSGEADIYAQHLDFNGDFQLYPAPYIAAIEDVPADEGGKVRLYWDPSRLDAIGQITDYEIWRRASDGKAAASPTVVGSGGAKPPRTINGYIWEWLITLPASQQAQYSAILPTSKDWTPSDPAYEAFKVVALTSNPATFYESPVDSGYSRHDLAPAVPQGFAGIYYNPPGRTYFSWNRNTEADLSHYAIHSGTPNTFVPDETNLLGTTTDTTFSRSIRPMSPTYYKLLACDIYGNASEAAVLAWSEIPLGTQIQTYAATLAGSCIEVKWTLAEAGSKMSFDIFRARGAGGAFEKLDGAAIASEGLSYSFRDGSCEPGEVYRYRIDVTDEEGTRTLFETDAIFVPALPLTLFQNHPNPFNPSTRIRYYVPERSRVRLEIYDVSGARVATLVDVPKEKGFHAVDWNGVDSEGRQAASGVYLYRLAAGKETVSMKMILLR